MKDCYLHTTWYDKDIDETDKDVEQDMIHGFAGDPMTERYDCGNQAIEYAADKYLDEFG